MDLPTIAEYRTPYAIPARFPTQPIQQDHSDSMRFPNSFAHSRHRRIQCLFLTAIVSLGSGTTSNALPVPARSTESFVNSIGVCLHIAYNNTAYNKDSEWSPLLINSGIRHVRDGLLRTPLTSDLNQYNHLAAEGGIGFTVVMGRDQLKSPTYSSAASPTIDTAPDVTATTARVIAAANLFGTDVIEAFEGENEIQNIYVQHGKDTSGNITDWNERNVNSSNAQRAKDYQTIFFNALKSDPVWRDLPVHHATFVGRSAAEAMTGWSQVCDMGTIHSYPAPRNITPTYGISDEGGSAENVCGDYGTISTETGFTTVIRNDANVKQPATPIGHGKYIPRTLLAGFNMNVGRSFLYEFLDEYTDKDAVTGIENNSNAEAHYGIVDRVIVPGQPEYLAPKEGYTAIKNLISRLKEASWNKTTKLWSVHEFNTGHLDFELSGPTKNIHTTLLQKSTGKFYLAIWQDAQSMDTSIRSNTDKSLNAPRDINVPTVAITLKVNTPVSNVFEIYNPRSNATTQGTLVNKQSVINVPDEVILIELTPTGSATPAAAAYWHFDEMNKATAASDWSGNNRDLTFQSPTYGGVTRSGGKDGSVTGFGTRYNGLNAYASAASVVDSSASYTISAWVRPDGPFTSSHAVSQIGTSESAYSLGIETDGRFRFRVAQSDGAGAPASLVLSSVVATSGKWYHLAGVHDATADRIRLYVNGYLQGEQILTTTFNATGGTRLGGSQSGGVLSGPWKGLLDEVRIFASALTDEKVKVHASGKLSRAGWTASVSSNTDTNATNTPSNPANVLDNSQLTTWRTDTTNGMNPNMWFQIDRGPGTLPKISLIVLDSGNAPYEFPRAYQIQTGDTTGNLSAIKTGSGYGSVQNIWLDVPTDKRIIRIVQTGDTGYSWKMSDLQMYGGFETTGTLSCEITSPLNGANVANAGFTITASAEDGDSAITSVQFFNGATLLATDTTAPYQFEWNSPPSGEQVLKASATNTEGQTQESLPVIVTVLPPPVGSFQGTTYEPFDYGTLVNAGNPATDGNLSANSGGSGFNTTGDSALVNTTAWGTGTNATVPSDSLVGAVRASIGNRMTVTGVGATTSSISRSLGQTVSAGSLYFSYFTRRETDSLRSINFGLFFGSTEKITIGQYGNSTASSSGGFSAAFLNNSSTMIVVPSPIHYGTGITHFVVVRVDFNASGSNERVRIYLDPSPSTLEWQLTPYINSTFADLGTIDGFRIFAGGTTTGFTAPSSGSFDEIRFGSSFASVAPPPDTPIEFWRLANFNNTSNQGVAADDADDDSDGIRNLMEYALDLDPQQHDASPPPFLDTTTGYLSLDFPRHNGRTDLTYQVRASSNLVDWTTIASSTSGAPFVASGARLIVETGEDVIVPVTVEDSFEILSNPQRFLRLEVTR